MVDLKTSSGFGQGQLASWRSRYCSGRIMEQISQTVVALNIEDGLAGDQPVVWNLLIPFPRP